MIMKLKHLFNLSVIAGILATTVSCGETPLPSEDEIYNSTSNESFVENPLLSDNISRIWTSPAVPNADEPLTISFKAGKTSPLRGYKGEVYAHIGILEYGTWKFVQAEWTENIEKCRFTPDEKAANTWHLELKPSIRQYFESGTTPVTQIGIVIRNSDGTAKGIEADSFIPVTDDLYKPFETGTPVDRAMPATCTYGINVVDNSTITFVLHDKDTRGDHKDYAYIMGDFNNWTLSNDDKSMMYRDDAAGCWWITVTGLDPDKEYRYQYHVGEKPDVEGQPDHVVRLSDAFSEKILDPSSDPWINYHNPIYPESEMVYPAEEGASGLVSCVKINRDPFTWEPFTIKNEESLVIYEMLFGDFTETADIAGAIQKLDYLQTLGINAVELMPVQEFDGNESWGYNPTHYFALDKAYGTREQYKTFINECHKRGIAVIIDVVYNHSTGASPLAKIYWNSSENKTAPNNPYFNVDAKHPFNVFHDINHENEFMQDVVKRSLAYLIKEYNVDGFRFDLSKGFTQSSGAWDSHSQDRINLILEYNEAIKAADPSKSKYVILEHWGQHSEESIYVKNGLHPWRKMNSVYITAAEGNGTSDLSGAYPWLDSTFGASGWVTFMESHDEERMAYKQLKYGYGDVKTSHAERMQNLALNAVCFLGVPGPKMIWQMGELGYDYNKWCTPDGVDKTGTGEYETSRKPVKWDYLDDAERKGLYDVYCKMNALRNNNPELFGKTATFTWTPRGWPMKTLELSSGSKKVYGYANYNGKSEAAQTLTIPSGTWTDYLSGKTVQGGSYTLNPGEALVLVNSEVK